MKCYNQLKIMAMSIFLIALMPLAFGDEGITETHRPNEVFGLPVHFTNETGDVTGANCSIQIMNSSYDSILDDILVEKGKGWYNYTYNTSRTGRYYCRENCTIGSRYGAGTCDFIIKGDNNLEIAIALILVAITAIFFILSYALSQDKHPALKVFFFIIAMVLTVVILNYAYQISVDNNASSGVQRTMQILYRVGIYSFVVFMIYVVVYYLFTITMFMKNYARR